VHHALSLEIPEALWIETPMRMGLIFTAMLATLM
jgi:hypothetical protein